MYTTCGSTGFAVFEKAKKADAQRFHLSNRLAQLPRCLQWQHQECTFNNLSHSHAGPLWLSVSVWGEVGKTSVNGLSLHSKNTEMLWSMHHLQTVCQLMLWCPVCELSLGSGKGDGSETGLSNSRARLWSGWGRLSLEYSAYHSCRNKMKKVRKLQQISYSCAFLIVSYLHLFLIHFHTEVTLSPWPAT